MKESKIINKIKNRKKEITVILIVFFVMLLFLTGYSLGKGFTKIEINGSTKIAKPIIEVENASTLELNNENSEGVYEFKVRNYNSNGEITDVNLEYYIEILNDLDDNNTIKIKLLKNDEEIAINDNKTEKFYLEKEKMQEDVYKMEISYDKTENISMKDIMELIQIKVHSEQMQEVV